VAEQSSLEENISFPGYSSGLIQSTQTKLLMSTDLERFWIRPFEKPINSINHHREWI